MTQNAPKPHPVPDESPWPRCPEKAGPERCLDRTIQAVSPALLRCRIGDSQLLARPGDWRLWLLNATAACLWDWHRDGLDAGAMAAGLTRRHGITADTARAEVAALMDGWREAGLLGLLPPPDPEEAAWTRAEDPPSPWPDDAIGLRLAGLDLGLWVERATLEMPLASLVAPIRTRPGARAGSWLGLLGDAEGWRLQWNGATVAAGRGIDVALGAVLRELIERACRAFDRLLVVHGAGLVGPDGRGLLLTGPGGSGKTTLAAALNAGGLPLLHDDVVPVDRDGHLLGLGLPLTLKAGSWPVLGRRRPELAGLPMRRRLGQSVRYLPPLGPSPSGPTPPGLLLFPRYRPGAPASRRRLAPEDALRGLIEADAVIRGLTQARLERLARWVEGVPSWSLAYPDLDDGVASVHALLADAAVA